MEQIKHFLDWYIGLFSDTDNKVRIAAWAATITTLGFIISTILKPSRQYIIKKLGNKKRKSEETKNSIPVFEIKMDRDSHFLPIEDKDFNSKIELAKQIFRSQKTKGLRVKVVPNFSLRKLNVNEKRTFDIKLQDKANELEKKLEILLARPIDFRLELPENILKVFNSLLVAQNPFVTGKTKIELYRINEPKIDFSIYLTNLEMQSLADNGNETIDSLKQILRIPTMVTTDILNTEIFLCHVIPALVREIYRIQTMNNFDITKPHWESIHSYSVGLG